MIERLLDWLEERGLDWVDALSIVAVVVVVGLLLSAAWGWIK